MPGRENPMKLQQGPPLQIASVIVGVLSVASLLYVLFAGSATLPSSWKLQVAMFAAVSMVPHWFIEWLARFVLTVGRDLEPEDHVPGLRNPGAYLGMVERALFLGALVGGYPAFVGVWYVFKGIADYRVGLPDKRARRTFQLFLLNNAVSLAGVGLGWMTWGLLGLPTR